MEQDQNHSHLGSLPVNKSVLSLMEKIPDEAESLTVLVGGVKFLKEPVLAFVRLAQSHVLGDLTEAPVPVRFLYLLLGPEDGPQDYHEVGRAMATLMSDKRFHEVAYSAVMDYDLLDAIDEFLDDSIVLPPGDWDQNLLLPIMHERNELRRRKERKKEEAEARQLFAVDPLKHTCRPCGGIWNDLKKLRKRYISDFQDAFHFQVFLTVIFLFITLIAPAIAFGGLMEEITLDLIGETETLVATGLCGIVYGLFAVQPLTILAFTGPVLLFEEIVHQFAESNHIAYLEWRACISLWLMLILIIFAISESTHLVTYFTRFSEEIFTGVVVIFFIFEVSKTIYGIYQRNPICGINYPCGDFATFTNTCQEMDNLTSVMDMDIDGNLTDPSLPKGFRICNQPNTALWSTILCLGTFFIAALLRKFRQGKFLGKKARRLMSDFGVFTALTIMVIVAYLLRNVIAVETLIVSSGFRPSNNAARGWFINPFGGRISVREGFAALGLGILLAILIFIENQLTVLVVNKPEHKLKKEVGYHFDLLIVAVLAGVCGLFGMPWMSAASIRSVQHIQALSVYSRKNAPGEKPVLKHVYEQRITNIAIHILIILSPLAYRLLRQVPVSVVVGVFLYLAYASINGVQLKTRIKLIFTPPKHFPDVHYVRKVPTLRMHLYTGIQVLSIAILWAIKLSPAAMIYPIAIVFLIPVRKFLGKFVFTHNHIEALDSHEDFPEDHEDGEGNEYDETNVPY